jgi:FMN phosphatase YigB (HAD superfamily)
MGSVNSVEYVFFDIGGTLGNRDSAGDFSVFPSSKKLLNSLGNTVGVRIGVSTTLGDLTEPQERNLLVQAGLAGLLDPQGFTSEHSTGDVAKPDPGVYRTAARQSRRAYREVPLCRGKPN